VRFADGTDNYKPLTSLRWQVHVYGDASPELRAASEALGVELFVFGWVDAMQRSGFQRSALYLVRPDGYVALADAAGGAASLRDYANTRGLAWTKSHKDEGVVRI
jgi:hypothetical protein